MARLNVSVVATGIPEEVNKYKIVFLKLQKPKNIWTKKMSCRQFLERGCPQPSGSPPFPGSASIRQVISSTQDNTLPHTEAKATFFRHLPMQRSAPVRSSSQGQGNFRRWSSRNHQVSLHEGDDKHWSWFSATIQKLLNQRCTIFLMTNQIWSSAEDLIAWSHWKYVSNPGLRVPRLPTRLGRCHIRFWCHLRHPPGRGFKEQ